MTLNSFNFKMIIHVMSVAIEVVWFDGISYLLNDFAGGCVCYGGVKPADKLSPLRCIALTMRLSNG